MTLTDPLPAGLTGYVLGGPDAGLCVLGGGFVTCTFEEMAPGDEFEITITGTTDPADCPEVTNPVAIEADNEDPEDDATTPPSPPPTSSAPTSTSRRPWSTAS